MTREEGRAAEDAVRELVEAGTVHPLGLVVLTEPSGARCMELRRWVAGRALVLRAPFSPVVLEACEVEEVPIEYRHVVRLPKDDAP